MPVILLLVATFGAAYAVPAAQTAPKKALTIDDYSKWKTINAPELSGDGNGVSYGVSLTDSINTIKMRYTLNDKWTIKTEAGKERAADLVFTIEK